MKKQFKMLIGFLTLVLLLSSLPLQVVRAAGGSVTVKNYTYSGYPYVQITKSSYPASTASINKILKWHAVNNAIANGNLKKEDANYEVTGDVQVLYNKNGKLSISYIDYVFMGGAHGSYSTEIYNYDMTTGKRITLSSILNSSKKIDRTKKYISYVLGEKVKKGDAIFEENVNDFPFDPLKTPFYLRDSGITIKFYPYEVASFARGFVDVTIPYSEINK